jgi:hypothetical protein
METIVYVNVISSLFFFNYFKLFYLDYLDYFHLDFVFKNLLITSDILGFDYIILLL